MEIPPDDRLPAPHRPQRESESRPGRGVLGLLEHLSWLQTPLWHPCTIGSRNALEGGRYVRLQELGTQYSSRDMRIQHRILRGCPKDMCVWISRLTVPLLPLLPQSVRQIWVKTYSTCVSASCSSRTPTTPECHRLLRGVSIPWRRRISVEIEANQAFLALPRGPGFLHQL